MGLVYTEHFFCLYVRSHLVLISHCGKAYRGIERNLHLNVTPATSAYQNTVCTNCKTANTVQTSLDNRRHNSFGKSTHLNDIASIALQNDRLEDPWRTVV